MCEAKYLYDKIKFEDYNGTDEIKEDFFYICNDYDKYIIAKKGFIFKDGSILALTRGNNVDHRILNEDLWSKLNLITYLIYNDEIDVRVYGLITYSAVETLVNLALFNNKDLIIIDIYDYNDRRKGSIEITNEGIESHIIKKAVETVLYQ